MIIRFPSLVVMILLISTLSNTQSIPDCKLKDENVERLIANKVQELRGSEYCQFRKYCSIVDIDGDKKHDFVVIFSVEGVNGNMGNLLQFMYVFLSTNSPLIPLQIQIGERGKAIVKTIHPTDNRIDLIMDAWETADALCCPSKLDTLSVSVTKNRLTKISKSKKIRFKIVE